MSAKHTVFVLNKDGKPLTPTTPARTRKLLKAGVAKPVWSKFNTFGIQMLIETREEIEDASLGIDGGTKFEGYSVVVGTENLLNVKLDLPDKKKIVRKLEERRALRRARRFRKWRRPKRFDNRRRDVAMHGAFIAPSQLVLVQSRLKMIREFFRMYPINYVGLEDVRFNHAKHRWGANFSTVEIGKQRIKDAIVGLGAELFEYRGFETQELRKQYGYLKTKVKNVDKFTAHCSDSLTLAVDVLVGDYVEPGPLLVVNDTYRPVRRRLHDTQFSKGGIRYPYSKGSIFGTRKGVLVGLKSGEVAQLCGENKGSYRFYRLDGRRGAAKSICWISNHYFTKEASAIPHPR